MGAGEVFLYINYTGICGPKGHAKFFFFYPFQWSEIVWSESLKTRMDFTETPIDSKDQVLTERASMNFRGRFVKG